MTLSESAYCHYSNDTFPFSRYPASTSFNVNNDLSSISCILENLHFHCCLCIQLVGMELSGCLSWMTFLVKVLSKNVKLLWHLNSLYLYVINSYVILFILMLVFFFPDFWESTYLLEVIQQQLHLVMLCLPISLLARHLLVPPCTCMEKRSPNHQLILSSKLSFLYQKLNGSNIKFMIKEL